MAELTFTLHEAQRQIFNSPARFKVVPAGRRFGKTFLAAVSLITEALADESWGGVQLTSEKEVFYVAPTFEQAKTIIWPLLKRLLEPLIASGHCRTFENTGIVEFSTNGRKIRLKGADNPDSLRGVGLSHCVLDEYADMSDRVWEEIIRPALMDVKGSALFIGTPKGKNHFYGLYKLASEGNDPEWDAFAFTSADNPYIDRDELGKITRDMSSKLVAQEIEASFVSHGGKVFTPDHFEVDSFEPASGEWAIACDLAGFSKSGTRSADYEKRDETAIAVVKVSPEGWWVKEIRHGRWDVRETALQILTAARSVGAQKVGIEKGVTLQAVSPYLTELMRQFHRWLEIVPLSHGNKKKYDRIQWALQGRAEKGKIKLNPGPWNRRLIEQACDFPDHRSKDDLLDALAYIDQMAQVVYMDEFTGFDSYEPLDSVSGY